MEFKLYSVKNYEIREKDFENYVVKYNNIENVIEELKNDNSYHLRLLKGNQYVFYLDLDGYTKDINIFFEKMTEFFKSKYNYEIKNEDIKYTLNDGKNNSYHISIPTIFCTTYKQKEIVSNFKKYADIEIKECIDTTVYSDKWFRLPNQTKGTTKNKPNAVLTTHKVIKGTMQDFILNYVPNNSFNFENQEYISPIEEKKEKKEKIEKLKEEKKNEKIKIKEEELKKEEETKNKMIEMIENNFNTEYDLVSDLLDMLDNQYYDNYENWRNIGFILKKLDNNKEEDYFKLFDKFSKKSKKYNKDEVKNFYNSISNYDIKINLASLHFYAKNIDFDEYKKICRKYNQKKNIEITEKYIAVCVNKFAGDHFIFCDKILYSYNEKNGLWYKDQPEIMKKYINGYIYDFLVSFLLSSIEDSQKLNYQLSILKMLCCTNKGKNDVFLCYRTEYMIDDNKKIEFDNKYYLLGFTNGVYDLIKNKFRKYKYTDYITLTTGYEYKKADDKHKNKLLELFNKIETNEEKRNLLLQILATGIIGKSYQKFILFNGGGGNGKSLIDKLNEKTIGNFYYKGKITTLCEPIKNGANPETAFMDKKRLIVFSEPKETQKINNGTMKELTGDSTINARKLFSNETQTKIYATFVLMCNKKIYLEDEPTDGEIRRMIDFLFESKFTENKDDINHNNKIFEADLNLLNDNILEELKFSYLEILIEYAHKFLTVDNEQFNIPESVKIRTEEYLKKSYNFLEYLNLICVKDENEHIKISDFVENLKNTDLYLNSTKEEKKKLTKIEAIKFFSTNPFIRKNFVDRYRFYVDKKLKEECNVLKGYKFSENINDDD
jgi:phage/plasmid-associated DNA primase